MAVLQHTDSTQSPLAQSLPIVQVAPSSAPALELDELLEVDEPELDEAELLDVALELTVAEPPVLELDALLEETVPEEVEVTVDALPPADELLAWTPPVELLVELAVAAPPLPQVTSKPQSDDSW